MNQKLIIVSRVCIPIVSLLSVVFELDFKHVCEAGFGCHLPFPSHIAVTVFCGINPFVQ